MRLNMRFPKRGQGVQKTGDDREVVGKAPPSGDLGRLQVLMGV